MTGSFDPFAVPLAPSTAPTPTTTESVNAAPPRSGNPPKDVKPAKRIGDGNAGARCVRCGSAVALPAALRRTRLIDNAQCSSCAATGSTLTDEALDALAAEESARINAAALQERWFASVDPRFRDATSTAEKVLDRLARLRAGEPAGLVIQGNYGSGKTWAAYALLNEIVRQGLVPPGKRILHGTETDLLAAVSMAPYQERERLRLSLLDRRIGVVLIDDVGHGVFRNEDERVSLYHSVLNHYWAARCSVILTTNLLTEELKGWLGPAAYDRLVDIVRDTTWVLPDKNVRRELTSDFRRTWGDTPPPDATRTDV